MSRIMKKVLCTFLCMILCMSIAARAYATSDELNEAIGEKESLESQLEDTQTLLNDLETKKLDTVAYITELDTKLTEVSANIEALNTELEYKQSDIADAETLLAESEAKASEQYESMKVRIKYMYEQGNASYAQILLNAKSMSDLLNKAEYVSKISEYDRDMLVAYQETIELVASTKAQLETEYDELEELQAKAEDEKASLDLLMEAKTEELNEYNDQIVSTEALESKFVTSIEEQENLISEIEAEIESKAEEESRKAAEEESRKAAEAAAQAASNSQTTESYGNGNSSASTIVTSGNGVFVWPCPGYSYISSTFGTRVDPITGEAGEFHKGLDMAAATGTDILAAASGEVVISRYSSSAGNYIMISHGGGLYTVYMHCSELLVSVGDTVSAGELIARVGSTGNSTGPHLHFGVRLNGEYVNPSNYL